MLIQKCNELYQQMRHEMETNGATEKCGAKAIMLHVPVIRRYLKLLRELALSQPFENLEEEIVFFKDIKPKFYQWLIYYVERYTIHTSRPMESGKALSNFYTEQLKYYRRSLRQYEFYYQYYKLSGVELDQQYFIRGAEIPPVMVPEVPEVDRSFGTAMDYLVSKFMAYENLQEYLLGQLTGPSGSVIVEVPNAEDYLELNWTGETINLLELAYGIYYTKQVNDGKASIIDIVRKLERMFKVVIGRPYRRLLEIKQRKRLSRTKYIDEMARSVNKKIDDDDAFDPNA